MRHDRGSRSLGLALAVAVAVVVVLGVIARTTSVTGAELAVSRWFLAGPDLVARPLWLVMQAGSLLGGLAVGVVVLGVCRGWRGALAAVVAVVGAWAGARLVKDVVDRGRPADYLTTIDTRFEPVLHGGGFVSGHTAVAFAVATLVAGCLPRSWRWAPFVVAAVVGVGRLYFGAHLALDVVGGAALGIAVGLACRWAFALTPRPEPD